jgi:hypothetical protein
MIEYFANTVLNIRMTRPSIRVNNICITNVNYLDIVSVQIYRIVLMIINTTVTKRKQG